ncbi:MAG: SBBP repeat-containing protein, partial [Bacteroidota bacterium]
NPYQENISGYFDAIITKLIPEGNELVYSTYLGGSGSDYGHDITIDANGNSYITGRTYSTDFPTENPYQGNNSGGHDAFITKLTPEGNELVYSTYLGGSDSDYGHCITIDFNNSAYITGFTESTDFPTENPYQENISGYFDAIITKLIPEGNELVYSTYLG